MTVIDIVEFWFWGWLTMFTLIVVVAGLVNPKFIKSITNLFIIACLSLLSWLGFSFILVTFLIYYISDIKNHDKDIEE